jgi:hypothetical protein
MTARLAAVIITAALGGGQAPAAAETPAAGGPGCEGAAMAASLVARFRRAEYLDVHHLVNAVDLLCPSLAGAPSLRVLDALSLLELDEPGRAQGLLSRVAADSADPSATRAASVILTWSFLKQGDAAAFGQRLQALPPPARLRLGLLSRVDDEAAFGRLLDTAPAGALPPETAALASPVRGARRTKRPWLAGLLSALVPGAGQAYAGSWQGAAVAFVLSSTFVAATAELAARRMYFPAVAAGVGASFFYVGNIFNAADLAARRDEMTAAAPYRTLETRLVPEAHP